MRIEEVRSGLCARLRLRREEIEQTALARAHAIADPVGADPSYREGLRASVSAALDYAFEAIESGEQDAPPPPPVLLAQARLAARRGVGLDTVLRRYLAGYSLLGEYLIAEGGTVGPGTSRGRLLHGHAAVLDRLLAAVSEEYTREASSQTTSREERLAQRVERLLAGELLDTAEFEYDFGAHHLGLACSGPGAEKASRELAGALDCRLLFAPRDERFAWAWLGSRRGLEPAAVAASLAPQDVSDLVVAIGESGTGPAGWRLTHRQAVAALPVALHRRQSPVCYAEVALLASALQDELLAASLRRYLAPLDAERDGGTVQRETLRAYIAAGGSISAAAASLELSRRTIGKRLRKAEELIGRPLYGALAKIDTALRFEELDSPVRASQIGPFSAT